MTGTVPIKLRGLAADKPALPPLFVTARRSADPADDDPFLPMGYLRPTATFDVSPGARGAADGAAEHERVAQAGEVVMLELTDGSVLVTSAERLRASLAIAHPELLGEGDAVLLEQLRANLDTSRGLGDVAGGLIRRVFTFIAGEAKDAIIQKAAGSVIKGAAWGGTKALMWAIEDKLGCPRGRLYRWVGASGKQADLAPLDAGLWFCGPEFRQAPDVDDRAVADARLLAEAARQPMLVFVHGTASSTLGSFGDLRSEDRDLWGHLERRYTGGVYGFEHRTLSESPIENAIQLATALPAGARLSLVSHSRGGLVADLLCLGDFSALIDAYRNPFALPESAAGPEATALRKELDQAHAEQREQLKELAQLLARKRLVIERYVRVACPGNGTKLASGNIDVFLSAVLTLIGAVPFFFGSPIYSAFKRVVIEVAKNRTDPHLMPGVEAMLPDSPLARLLCDAPVREGVRMAVIAGDTEGGGLLKRLGVMLTDFLIYDQEDNDLVVNTPAMYAGTAVKLAARTLFDRGPDVSHFRYFANIDTRNALRDWLVTERAEDLARVELFQSLPTATDDEAALVAADAQRAAGPDERPVVVVLPGIMGSHLQLGGRDRVWLDPLDIAAGGLAKIAWGRDGVEAEEIFALSYGQLCKELAATHRVERFAYDWRQPLDVLAERFGAFLDRLLDEAGTRPVRLLAHSMGGLVVRATIHKRRGVMDRLMQRKGAQLVMMGTPNQGAHSMVETLIGKGDTLRMLVRLDLSHDMQQVLDLVAGFRGALQLLPKPGFTDTFQGQSDGGEKYNYQDPAVWRQFKTQVTDFWFGDGRVGTPGAEVLASASWLWTQDGLERPALPAEYEKNSVYVFGVAPNTPCGVRPDARRRLRMVGTARGDGTVTWDSGRIGGIGRYYYLPAVHGDLLAKREHFGAIVDLLMTGATARLATTPPAVRAVTAAGPVLYDAGAPIAADGETVARRLVGASPREPVQARARRRLEVTIKAMDLRFLARPILVGHYENDPIAGAELLIDRDLLDGDLRKRHDLGLYAGPRGTATVVLQMPNAIERARGTLKGAVVTGLGNYDTPLGPTELTEAVRVGALRYLLHLADVLGKQPFEAPLAVLLLGYNSSANLTIESSVEALVRGVLEANARFRETTRLDIRIASLDIVELYLDTAITAVYALRKLAPQLKVQAAGLGTQLIWHDELVQQDGVRQRLFDGSGARYWPRLIVTDAQQRDEGGDPGEGPPSTPATCPAGRRTPTVIADRLRFLFVGQRARAESVVQQRQPGLVESLVRQQISVARWMPEFGRMLFQLMVPNDFKAAARELDRVVLVVDAATANLPWELMVSDDPNRPDGAARPLALRTAVVRQLATTRFRRQVRQSIGRTALVIGNPSVEGFAQAFPAPAGMAAMADPPDLPGAEAEAEATAQLLGSLAYDVDDVIGERRRATDVMAKLFQRPWRLLHISAHGVFDLLHADGRRRSGVVLSDGLLITAAEISAMEVVPELVFLNCCHLGQVDLGRDANKLAASVARELIDIGVRCVVVAGWAVSDLPAKVFAETFYEQLLLTRLPFGDAVFEARKAVWATSPDDITWGAFQAYGDPGWLAEPQAEEAGGASATPFASPEELLDELARLRSALRRRGDPLAERETRAQIAQIDALFDRRSPPGWRELPQIQSALGATWFDLGQFDRAREAFLSALQAVQHGGVVPIRDIERLANAEVRLAEKRALHELGNGQPGDEPAEALIDLAIRRLDQLDAVVASGVQAGPARQADPERCALRGRAWKSKATLQACRILIGTRSAAGLPPAESDAARDLMVAALRRSIKAYQEAEGQPGSKQFDPYQALNRLALHALVDWTSPADRTQAIELAQHCQQRAAEAGRQRFDFWGAAMQADGRMVECLLDGTLERAGDDGRAALDDLKRSYRESLANVGAKPAELDSVVTQLELLSRFYDAMAAVRPEVRDQLERVADRLLELVPVIQPARPPREDRPKLGRAAGRAAVAAEGTASGAAPAPSARKPVARKPR